MSFKRVCDGSGDDLLKSLEVILYNNYLSNFFRNIS